MSPSAQKYGTVKYINIFLNALSEKYTLKICENNICVANFMFDQEVNYTFKRGTPSSYIDHVFVQWHNLHIIKRCDILHDNSDNESYHFPISFTLDLPLSSQTQKGKVNERCINSTYPAWDNPTSLSCYSNAVSELMDAIPVSD